MTWIQTGAGRAFELVDPSPELVDFDIDIPEALARIPRFTGHIRSGQYSVAEHCVVGADVMLRETGNEYLALAFLLHDAHEAYVGDIATPISGALAEIAGREFQGGKPGYEPGYIVKSALKTLKFNIDRAIHLAAGVDWPLPAVAADMVHAMDIAMLQAERRQLLGRAPKPWDKAIDRVPPARLIGKLKVLPWPVAADAWRDRLRRWCPAARDHRPVIVRKAAS